MARKDRIEAVLATEKPNLQTWIEGEDARLDAERDVQVRLIDRGRWEKLIGTLPDAAIVGEDPFMRDGIIGPLVDVLTDHAAGDYDQRAAQRTRARKPKDPNVRFVDELDAVRYWCSKQDEVRSGDFDRIAQRGRLGATIQSSTCNAEPVEDPYAAAVDQAMDAVGEDLKLVMWAHFEFVGPQQRRLMDVDPKGYAESEAARESGCEMPRHIADELLRFDERQSDTQMRERFETYARWLRKGKKIKADEETVRLSWDTVAEPTTRAMSAMALAAAIRRSGARMPEGSQLHASTELRWEHLIAERLELNVSGALGPIDPRKDPGEHADCRMTWLEASAREVRERYSAARRALREALLAIELDTRPRFLVPAPAAKDLEADARAGERVTVACCGGIRVVEGVRQPCEVVEVEGPARRHPSSAWARCEVCGAPVARIDGLASS